MSGARANSVSGTSDHPAVLPMCMSPRMCMSATSLGRVLVSRYSLRTFRPTVMATVSNPATVLSVSISWTS